MCSESWGISLLQARWTPGICPKVGMGAASQLSRAPSLLQACTTGDAESHAQLELAGRSRGGGRLQSWALPGHTACDGVGPLHFSLQVAVVKLPRGCQAEGPAGLAGSRLKGWCPVWSPWGEGRLCALPETGLWLPAVRHGHPEEQGAKWNRGRREDAEPVRASPYLGTQLVRARGVRPSSPLC